jgi:hypothetical protein
LGLCLAALCGCFGNEASLFPPGLEPLEDNDAPLPAAVPDNPFPETLVLVSGETTEYSWAHGRGFVQASQEKVWAAIRDPSVMADRRNTDSQSFTYDIEQEYDFSFEIHYVVNDLVTVEWDELWRLGAIEGDLLSPTFGLARYQKVYGTQFITLLEGSIMLLEVDADTTEVQLIEHTKAVSTDATRIEGSMTDRFANIVASAHGEPLPEF